MEKLEGEKGEAGLLRYLLYEKGKPLEVAILVALSYLGFRTESFRDAESEFDAIFVGPEGRFLGEAEGKDNKPINIDKLGQLERNIQEDFAKEGTAEYAQGVLFGNAYRLEPPNKRGAFFTAKCVAGARRAGISLIRTPDLFEVARYLKENDNKFYAEQCRKAILDGKGRSVEFPAPPVSQGMRSAAAGGEGAE